MARTQHGESLLSLSQQRPLLVVFLRHLGCPFSRQALFEMSVRRAAMEGAGTHVVFVHMGTDPEAASVFSSFGLTDMSRVSDPEATLYRAFGLERGGWAQVAGPSVWLPGAAAIIKSGIGTPRGDVRQMPGVFLVRHGAIVKAFRHDHTSDMPDYDRLASCPQTPDT
jgi:hypothetical protein